MASTSFTAVSSSMNANAIQNLGLSSSLAVPFPVAQPSQPPFSVSTLDNPQNWMATAPHFLVPPLFSQDDDLLGPRPSIQQKLSPLCLRLDVDKCLKELKKRRRDAVQVADGESKSNIQNSRRKMRSMNPTVSGASTSLPHTPVKHDCAASASPANKVRLKFVLEKQLTKSDVSTVGRIILPKKQAEAKLPILDEKWGITLTVRDALDSDKWKMRYRYWPNNKSKMYVLENTGEFIQKYHLTSGDSIAIYQDDKKQNFIYANKITRPRYPLELVAYEDERAENDQVATMQSTENVEGCRKSGSSSCDKVAVAGPSTTAVENQWDSSDNVLGVDADFTDFSNRSLNQYGKFPSFDDCDLSLFDFRAE